MSGADPDRKQVKIRHWRIIRSQIRHRGLFWWLVRKLHL